jgi:Virulence factor BrkB
MLEAGGAWLDQNLAQLRDRGRRAQDWTERVAPPLGRASRFVWEVLIKYHRDDCFTYAASLSFFLTISLIPLATLFFRLMAILLGSGAYSQALYRGLLEMYPYLPEGFIQDTIVHSRKIGGVGISWAILLIGAHWGVNQVDRSLCHIFDLRAKRHRQTRKHNLLRRLGVILLGLAFLVILLSAGFEWSLRRHAIFPRAARAVGVDSRHLDPAAPAAPPRALPPCVPGRPRGNGPMVARQARIRYLLRPRQEHDLGHPLRIAQQPDGGADLPLLQLLHLPARRRSHRRLLSP